MRREWECLFHCAWLSFIWPSGCHIMPLCLRLDVVRFIEFGLYGKQIYSLSCLFLHLPCIVPRPAPEETIVMVNRCYEYCLFTVDWLQIKALISMQMWHTHKEKKTHWALRSASTGDWINGVRAVVWDHSVKAECCSLVILWLLINLQNDSAVASQWPQPALWGEHSWAPVPYGNLSVSQRY